MKYAGAAAMYFVAKKLKKKYNITDERASLYDAANTWTEALNGRNFLGILSILEPNKRSILEPTGKLEYSEFIVVLSALTSFSMPVIQVAPSLTWQI